MADFRLFTKNWTEWLDSDLIPRLLEISKIEKIVWSFCQASKMTPTDEFRGVF